MNKASWLAAPTLAGFAFAAELNQDFQVRLLTPITSYSAVGTKFQARIVGTVLNDRPPLLPAGTLVHGAIKRAHSIGLGIRRERAVLDLEFTGCQSPQGTHIPCTVQLLSVDNARESVMKDNRIRGILAGSHPHSWLSGLWYRPGTGIFHRCAAGLTGAGGMIYSRLAPSPVSAGVIVVSRLVLFRMPDPEIELPAGTELILRITADEQANSEVEPEIAFDELSPELLEWAQNLPVEVTQTDRTAASDIINLAFTGSQEQLLRAFEAAGWSPAENLTARTFALTYVAFTSMKAYSTAPVSSIFYQGRLPDLVFQKSFNSLAKRHHIRIWAVQGPGANLWAAAATHDIAIAFDWHRLSLTHRIDPQLDKERSKVINDLTAAGSLAQVKTIERPDVAARFKNDAQTTTDGALAIVSLRDFEKQQEDHAKIEKRRSPIAKIVARRIILETRQYLMRGNAYYWAYRGARWSASSLRRQTPGVNE